MIMSHVDEVANTPDVNVILAFLSNPKWWDSLSSSKKGQNVLQSNCRGTIHCYNAFIYSKLWLKINFEHYCHINVATE